MLFTMIDPDGSVSFEAGGGVQGVDGGVGGGGV